MKMHANEVETSVSLVRNLLDDQFPQWADRAIQPVRSSGTDNVLYQLGDDLVVRLPRIPSAAAQIEKEYTWLPRLAPQMPVAIPTPLVLGQPGTDYPWHWTVSRWIEGENPSLGRIPDQENFVMNLAQFITALHAITTEDAPIAGRGEPLATRDEATRAAIAELQGMIDTDKAIALWDETLAISAGSEQRVWTHGDLMPGNLLCHDGRLTAVIDFGMMGMGDPSCDLIVAWNFLSAESRDLFRTHLHVDDDTWQRGRCWALSVALIQLPYYQDTNPILAATARYTIEQVMDGSA